MKTFKINDRITIDCDYKKKRNGFAHTATLYVDGFARHSTSVSYQNRTWEAYAYESVLLDVVNGATNISSEDKDVCLEFIKNYKEESPFGALAMVAKIGEVLTDSKAEANKWKVRMMKAGLGENVSFPDDWDTLSEDEKERRLNGALDSLKK